MNQPSEQGTTVSHHINVEQTVFKHFFPPSTTLNDWFNFDISITTSEPLPLF